MLPKPSCHQLRMGCDPGKVLCVTPMITTREQSVAGTQKTKIKESKNTYRHQNPIAKETRGRKRGNAKYQLIRNKMATARTIDNYFK